MKFVVALIGALILNASANLMMKMGMKSVADGSGLMANGPVVAIKSIITSPILLTGLICFGLNAGLYMFALQSKTLKISIAYPIMVGGGYAIIAIVAALAPSLKERLTTGQWIGVALVMIGVLTIAILTPSESAS